MKADSYITFWAINKGDKPKKYERTACFSPIWNHVPDAVRFMVMIADVSHDNIEIPKEFIDFYLGFMKRMLTLPGLPKWSMRKLKDNRILFRLESKGLNIKQTLFPLTWFRLLQEMPDIPHQLFLRRKEGDGDEETFRNFQQIHYDCLAGKITRGYYPNTNHGLILKDNYGSRSAGEPITIARLAENIKGNPQSVFAYFA